MDVRMVKNLYLVIFLLDIFGAWLWFVEIVGMVYVF